jgi:uncharacterized membrane-anchored protein YhcB (DUF1043 family)
MDLVALLMGLVIAIFTGAFIIRPLTEERPEGYREEDRELSSMQAEQDRILDLIEELEMDHAIGKVFDEDYQMQYSRLMQQGAENLKMMDELRKDSAIEGEEAQRIHSLEDELEVSVAKLRSVKPQRGQDFCGHCGAKILVGDRFCVACGAKLSAQEDRA